MSLAKLLSFLWGPGVAHPRAFQSFPSVAAHRRQLLSLTKRHPTPFFGLDRQTLVNRYQTLQDLLLKHWGLSVVAYSFKTNYALAKSGFLRRQGAWAEVVSGREYSLAKKLGYRGEQIVFNGPVKTDQDLLRASHDKALLHLDNSSELERFLALPRGLTRGARLGLRLNVEAPDLPPSRFGFSLSAGSARLALAKLIRAGVGLVSLHLHLGTDVDRVASYRFGALEMAKFCRLVERWQKRPIKFLDMGGGFPGGGRPPFGHEAWQPRPIEDYVSAMALVFKKNLPEAEKKTLLVEPGRYLVDDAAILVTRISDRKVRGRQLLLTDASVTMLPLKYYRPQIVKIFSPTFAERTKNIWPTTVSGASCREDDWLLAADLPLSSVGDFVVYYCVGAYNESMGSDFIFGKPKTFFI